jgi:hypothetical protein
VRTARASTGSAAQDLPARSGAGVRFLDELLWSLRRAGLVISTEQAITAARAVSLVGVTSRTTLSDALGAVIVTRPDDLVPFAQAFKRHFDGSAAPRDLFDRLRARGLSEDDLAELGKLLADMARASADGGSLLALSERGAELDRLLQSAPVLRALEAAHGSLQAGFVTHKVLSQVGAARASSGLSALQVRLADALGKERAEAITRALSAELSATENEVRSFVRERLERPAPPPGSDVTLRSFASLDPAEVREVRMAVRRFVERLWGRERVRRRLRRHGRIDPHATLRQAMRTQGVPVRIVRKERRPDRPKLMIFADVSDSVRASARFLLEFAYLAGELFERTRTFAFVSDLVETTDLFAEQSIDHALSRVYGGGLLSVRDNSNYGRVLSAVWQRYGSQVDRRTTVVILGDGRTNYLTAGAEALSKLTARAHRVLWLCPEPRGAWSVGDSRMREYERAVTQAFEMTNARELERAARALMSRRSRS